MHRKGMCIMLLLPWMNCWFARAASVCAEFAASDFSVWNGGLHILKSKLVLFCVCGKMGKNLPFTASLYCPSKCEIQAVLGSAVLLHSAHADLMFLCNIFCLVCNDLKIRKGQNVILLSWVQLKRIFMWILLCCYNLTLFDSFFFPFEHTGMEGKLCWAKDHPSSLPGSLRLGLRSVIDSCSLSQSKFPTFPLDLNSLHVGPRKRLIWKLCTYKKIYLCVKRRCCWTKLYLSSGHGVAWLWCSGTNGGLQIKVWSPD